ncbi:hypothetical protein MicloDRAFT_00010910 [Microvirga lotononidis]|uniref:Uncharacterized protein n=1 Tax=Microvirga lotononidis TaxID=864069 RepID=I4Z244_9HYPH|nr:hypothetical protein MicloDRAFT_00010910 [Microvirga lotononidis]
MSAISDVLALIVMERRGFTKRDYGLRHHGGYLGARARLDNAKGAGNIHPSSTEFRGSRPQSKELDRLGMVLAGATNRPHCEG